VLQKKVGGRTKDAIWKKVQREFGGGGITRGSMSLYEALKVSGYSRTHFLRAARALNQRWLRTKKHGDFIITFEQYDDIICWLGHDYWSKKLEAYCCLQCGTKARPHHIGGFCNPCFQRFRRRSRKLGVPHRAEQLREWVEKLPEDFRVHRALINLRAGRLPTIEDLEYLCALTKQ
jgi:hypothetical protein